VAQVFEALTVLQNVQLAVQARLGVRAVSAFKTLDGQSLEPAWRCWRRPGWRRWRAGCLEPAYGAKKRLELAVALAAGRSCCCWTNPPPAWPGLSAPN
jgi:branched-chain amino acid transport system ATP-binding protein